MAGTGIKSRMDFTRTCAILFLFLAAAWAAPNETNASAPAPTYLNYDGINIYFGNDSQLSIFSCIGQKCYPGFGAGPDYQSFGQPLDDKEVELAANFSNQTPGSCLFKLVSDQAFRPVDDSNGQPRAFSDGRLAYSFALQAGAPIGVEAQGNQLCISSPNESGLAVFRLIPEQLAQNPALAPAPSASPNSQAGNNASGATDLSGQTGAGAAGASGPIPNITASGPESGIRTQPSGSWLGPGTVPSTAQRAQTSPDAGSSLAGVLLPAMVVLAALAIAAYALFSHRNRPRHGGHHMQRQDVQPAAGALHKAPEAKTVPEQTKLEVQAQASPANAQTRQTSPANPQNQSRTDHVDAQTQPKTSLVAAQTDATAPIVENKTPLSEERKPEEKKPGDAPPRSSGSETSQKETPNVPDEKKPADAPPWAKGAVQKKPSEAPPWAN